jgi:hypothetical protein
MAAVYPSESEVPVGCLGLGRILYPRSVSLLNETRAGKWIMQAREARQWEISPLSNAALIVYRKHTFASSHQVRISPLVVI